MSRAFLLLSFVIVLGGCRSKESSRSSPSPGSEAGAQSAPVEVTTQVEVNSPVSPHHGAKLGFAVSAPRGTKNTRSGFALPDGTAIYVNPREIFIDPSSTYADHERPVSDRMLVTRDCTQIRGDFELGTWTGKPVLASTPEGFSVCVGPVGDTASCHIVDGNVAAAQAECGGGLVCLTRAQALRVLAVCTSLRRTGTDVAPAPRAGSAAGSAAAAPQP